MSGDKRSVATDALEVLGLPDLGGREVGRDAIHLAVEPAVAGETLTPGCSIHRGSDGLWYWVQSKDASRMAIVDPFLLENIGRGGRFLAIIPPRQITSLRHVWSHPDFPEDLHNACAEQSVLRPQPGASAEPESSPAMFRDEYAEDDPGPVEEPEVSAEEEADFLSNRISASLDESITLSTREYSEAWIRKMCEMVDCPDYDTLVKVASGDYSSGKNGQSWQTQWDDDYLHFQGRDAHGVIPSQFWRHLAVVTGKEPPKTPTYFSCGC